MLHHPKSILVGGVDKLLSVRGIPANIFWTSHQSPLAFALSIGLSDYIHAKEGCFDVYHLSAFLFLCAAVEKSHGG